MNLLDNANPHGPVAVNDLTITVDKDLCIGAATCLAIAPEVFALDNEQKAIILDSATHIDQATIVDAARGCPTAAITVVHSDGEQLFP